MTIPVQKVGKKHKLECKFEPLVALKGLEIFS